jgi:hypothetical protein
MSMKNRKIGPDRASEKDFREYIEHNSDWIEE